MPLLTRAPALLAGVLAALALTPVMAAGAPFAVVADDDGRVVIDEKPTRIISLSPAATETLFRIGAGDQVVAVDDQSNFPKNAPRTKLSGFTPNVEAIARFRPDLVVAEGDRNGLFEGLKKLSIPVMKQTAPSGRAAMYRQWRELGKATGNRVRANRLAAWTNRRIRNIIRRTPTGNGIRVYHEISPDFFSAQSKTFVGKAYRQFGMSNIADRAPDRFGAGFPQLSSEFIVSRDPDLIVLGDARCCGQNLATVRARPGWSGIDAVRSRNVVATNDDITQRWGPRIWLFYNVIAKRVTALKRASAR